jgi:hypothetical protein
VRGRLFPADGDWYEWRQDPPLPAPVFVRVGAAHGGRLVLTGLRLDASPTAELLRSVPVGRIEAAANAQLTVVDEVVVPVRLDRGPAAQPSVDGNTGWETTDPATARERAVDGGRRRGRPDEFYRDVARTYRESAQTSPRPVWDLADAHGVPLTTAHRWVKEARRRGFLPPGQPGKAG